MQTEDSGQFPLLYLSILSTQTQLPSLEMGTMRSIYKVALTTAGNTTFEEIFFDSFVVFIAKRGRHRRLIIDN